MVDGVLVVFSWYFFEYGGRGGGAGGWVGGIGFNFAITSFMYLYGLNGLFAFLPVDAFIDFYFISFLVILVVFRRFFLSPFACDGHLFFLLYCCRCRIGHALVLLFLFLFSFSS